MEVTVSAWLGTVACSRKIKSPFSVGICFAIGRSRFCIIFTNTEGELISFISETCNVKSQVICD